MFVNTPASFDMKIEAVVSEVSSGVFQILVCLLISMSHLSYFYYYFQNGNKPYFVLIIIYILLSLTLQYRRQRISTSQLGSFPPVQLLSGESAIFLASMRRDGVNVPTLVAPYTNSRPKLHRIILETQNFGLKPSVCLRHTTEN